MLTDSGSDYHIHTLVSDGQEEPAAMMEAAHRLGLRRISFTDHDAIGAYLHFSPDLFAQAGGLGIELISGIELDSDFCGHETHILGYGLNLADEGLRAYLARNQELRRRKVSLQIDLINRHFGRPIVDPQRVFLPRRDTLMKPHLVHALLDQRLFDEYRSAARWLNEAARVPVEVPKLTAAEAVALVIQAGGEAVLAHPGFLVKEAKVDLPGLLAELRSAGLAGMEVEYPYRGTGPHFPDPASEKRMVAELRRLARKLRLKATRGSDAHTVAQLAAFHRLPEPPQP